MTALPSAASLARARMSARLYADLHAAASVALVLVSVQVSHRAQRWRHERRGGAVPGAVFRCPRGAAPASTRTRGPQPRRCVGQRRARLRAAWCTACLWPRRRRTSPAPDALRATSAERVEIPFKRDRLVHLRLVRRWPQTQRSIRHSAPGIGGGCSTSLQVGQCGRVLQRHRVRGPRLGRQQVWRVHRLQAPVHEAPRIPAHVRR